MSIEEKIEADNRSVYVGNVDYAASPLNMSIEEKIEADNRSVYVGNVDYAASPPNMSIEGKVEADKRSVYVGNVDYGAGAEELGQHFQGCGFINRVTILCNKFDGHPKGFAYIEFRDTDSVHSAMAMEGSLFKGRQIKVMPKRTNIPGLSTTNRLPRGWWGLVAHGHSFRGGFSHTTPATSPFAAADTFHI